MHRIIRYSWLGKGTEFPPFHFTDSFFLEMAVEMLDFRNFREREVHEAASATLESVQNLIQLLSQQQQNNEGDTNCRSDDAAVNRLKKAVYAFGNTRGHARFRKAPPGSTPPSLVPKPETEQCCNKEFNHCCDENVSCVPVNNKLYYPTTTITTPLPPPPPPLPQTFIHNNAMTFSEHTFAQNNNPSFPSQALQINNKTDYNSSSGFKVWKEPVTSLSSPNSSLTASGLDPCEAASLLVKSLPAPAPVPSRPPWSSSSSSPKKSCTHGKSDDISGKCGTPGRCHCSKRKKSRVKRTLRVPAISLKMADIPSDEFSWRKYGQKPIKGSPHPRGYYKCSTVRGCPARKHVERAPDDPNVLIVTYEGEHYHSHSHSHTMSENTGLVVDP